MIYIKECRSLAIVQYKQHLQRNTEIEDKEDEEYYKLGVMGEQNLHYSDLKLSFTVWP